MTKHTKPDKSARVSAPHQEKNPSPQEINTLATLFAGGRYTEAATLAQTLTVRFPLNGIGWTVLGVAFSQMGRNADALAPMQKAAALSPGDADAHSNLGNTLRVLGRFDEAEASCRRALQIKPDFAEAHSNLGNTLRALGRLVEAEASYRRALQIKPNYAEAHSNLGNILRDLGRLGEAEVSYRCALELRPKFADTNYNLGNILKDLGRLNEAEASYRRALEIRPDFAEACYNLGNILKDLGRLNEAEASYRRVLEIKPNYAEGHNNLGNIFKDRDQLDEAEVCYRRALEINPNLSEVHINLGNTLKDLGRIKEAETSYHRALEIKPDFCEARVALVMLTLLIAPRTVKESAAVPDEFSRALRDFTDWLDSLGERPADFLKGICSQQPFYLAYRDGNHVDLLSRYGDLATKYLEHDTPASPGSAREKLRLVIVTRYFLRHPVWYIILRGLLTHLDRQKFEIILYHVGHDEDGETELAKSLAEVWRDARTVNSFDGWLDVMAADKPDVIFYPAIGMDPISLRLAAHRLAPLQVASWGHPITTGLPTIDLYLSGEMLEPLDADMHYRERLLRLPGTGCCTTPIEVISEELTDLEAELALRGGTRFVIAQTPFKFDPADDTIFASIAAAVSDSTFILLHPTKFRWATDIVFARLNQAFRDRGLVPEEHLLVIPWLPQEKFHRLLDLCDVYLDCPSFSGYTTAWQAVHRGLPIVTLEGKFMRQRLAAGLLRKIELTNTIATSADHYVKIATRLAEECRDPNLRSARRHAIKSAAPRMNNDVSVVRAFEKSLLDMLAEKVST